MNIFIDTQDMEERYKNPTKAWNHFKKRRWY